MGVYSLLGSIALQNGRAGIYLFIGITFLYLIRLSYLSAGLLGKHSGKHYSLVMGRVLTLKKGKSFSFIVPLNFLKVINVLPKALLQRIQHKAGLKMTLNELVLMILTSCIGTRIEINNRSETIFFTASIK